MHLRLVPLHAMPTSARLARPPSVLPCQWDKEEPHDLALNNSPAGICRARSELATVSATNGASRVATANQGKEIGRLVHSEGLVQGGRWNFGLIVST